MTYDLAKQTEIGGLNMTIEEKAKAYDEALERAKSWAEGKEEDLGASAKSVAEFIFPELAESEDE